jgi:XFP N-terminal domain
LGYIRRTKNPCREQGKLGEVTMANALSDTERALIDSYWRAANYLSVGQIYLYDNPLLKKPLAKEHIKPRLLGHWGTTPGSGTGLSSIRGRQSSIRKLEDHAMNESKEVPAHLPHALESSARASRRLQFERALRHLLFDVVVASARRAT